MTELTNDRIVVNWLGAIAVVAILGTVVMSQLSGDTTVIVALIGIASMCAGSLGTRRTRAGSEPADPTQPPPFTGGGGSAGIYPSGGGGAGGNGSGTTSVVWQVPAP